MFFDILKQGGILMIPIVACSIFALGIIANRFYSLRDSKILPLDECKEIWLMAERGAVNERRASEIAEHSPLGSVLVTGLLHAGKPRSLQKEYMEEAGRFVCHQMERYLNALGTIAAITPLLGLLGTVLGMIDVFAVITASGVGNPGMLAGGISMALITTAAGLAVAIPSLFFHRYFRARIDNIAVALEQEASRFADALYQLHTAKS